MDKEYKTKQEKEAYAKGIFAKINGLSEEENPYNNNICKLVCHKAWLEGFNGKLITNKN